MSAVVETTGYSPQGLLSMPDGDQYELVDGQLVERDIGAKSSSVGGQVFYLLRAHNQASSSGWLWPADCGYQCFRDAPDKVRKPDVSFVRFGRLPNEQLPEGFIRIPPDLAVEVISPRDFAKDTDEKVAEYLAAGVRLVWVIHPESKTVLVYRADGSIVGLRERDELSGEDVVPGFRCRVAEVFAPLSASPATQ
jgi:Uma2 family endonuclease